MKREPIGDVLETSERSSRARRRRRPEVWSWIAFLLFAATILLTIYLGLRPGGSGPVLAYSVGRDLLGMCAVLTGFFGVVWSLLHRPLLKRRRSLAFLCLTLVIGVVFYRLPYPSSHEGRPSSTCFRLPFEGEWTVFWGGDDKDLNRLAGFFADRRWGLDFVVTQDGMTHEGDGLDLEEYFVYGREVLAPADGTIVYSLDAVRDTQPGMLERGVEPLGNHVVIEVGDAEYVFLAHLKPGSVTLQAGERVMRGQVVGRVGNSGYSAVTPEPHLAIHLQDTPVPRRGEAIPWRFCDYSSDGTVVESGVPRGGVGPDGSFIGERVSALPE